MRHQPTALFLTAVSTMWLGLLSAGVTPAAADADSEYVREGPSISLAGVYAIQDAGGDFKNLDNTGGVHARLGVRIAASFEIGAYGEWLHYSGEDPGYVGAYVKIFPFEAFDMSLLGGILQPYAFGGAGVIFAEEADGGKTRAGANYLGGMGLDFYLTENLALFGEVHYSGAGGDPSGIRSTNILAGATWRF